MSKLITINSIDVTKFRNIKNAHYELNGSNFAFAGCNALGKTNLLNAIMWCLTGADLFDNAKDSINVPHDYDPLLDSIAVDVTVTLSVGSIRRLVVNDKGINKKVIYINGEECESIKNAELRIDSMLGTLELATINKSAKFSVRKFLLNPLYIDSVAPVDFRKFVLSLIDSYVNLDDVAHSLPSSVVSCLDSIANTRDVEYLSSIVKDKKKLLTNSKREKSIILDYISSNHPDLKNDIDSLSADVKAINMQLTEIPTLEVAVNKYALAVMKAYHKFCMNYFDGLSFVLLEPGSTDDTWLDVCYPVIKGTLTPFSRCSTSEKVRLGALFIQSVIKNLTITSTLPMLFDECETMDTHSLIELSDKVKTQFITSLVDSNCDHIEGRTF